MRVIAAACGVQSERNRVPLHEIGAPSKALRWRCLAPYPDKGFGCITLSLTDMPGAITDWTDAREIWLRIDAAAYDTQPTPFMFFFRSNFNWELCREHPQAYLYDLEAGQWITAPTDGYYSLLLPPGFRGWVRLPLGRDTFATPHWETPAPYEALRLDCVDMLSFGLAQRSSSAGAAADFMRFVLCCAPWHERDGLPGETGPWREIVPLDVLDTGVRLSEDNDRQNWGRDNNYLAGISFSTQVVEPTDEYLLVLAHAPLLLRIGGHRRLLPRGQVLLCPATDVQYLQSQGPPLVYDMVRMSLTAADRCWLEKQKIPVGEAVALKTAAAVGEWLRCMAQGMQTRAPGWQAGLDACVQGLLFVISQSMARPSLRGAGRVDKPLYLLRYQVYEDPVSAPSVNTVAQQMHLSVSGVQHAYKRLFGCSYTADVIASRIQYAQRLLEETDEPVTIVAERCGYETLPHFMRQFKQYTGLTPGAYRRQATAFR